MNPVSLQCLSFSIRRVPALPNIITQFIRLVFSSYMPYNLKFGKNFIFGHEGLGVIIHERTIIGNDIHIDKNVSVCGISKKYDISSGSLVVGIPVKLIKFNFKRSEHV